MSISTSHPAEVDWNNGTGSTEQHQEILENQIPKGDRDFPNTSFFNVAGRSLPSPSSVIPSETGSLSRGLVTLPELQLVIKYGSNVTIDEAMTMQKIGERFGPRVPVPEVFGWRVYQDKLLIYMEHIPGFTLRERWGDLSFSDKESVCAQLQQMLSSLRGLRHEKSSFIGTLFNSCHFRILVAKAMALGTVIYGPLLDRVFEARPKTGPFNSLNEFYKHLEWMPQRLLEASKRYEDPYLALMPKDSSIVFTHADVNPVNVMISASAAKSTSKGACFDRLGTVWVVSRLLGILQDVLYDRN